MKKSLSRKKCRPQGRRLANRERIYLSAMELFDRQGYGGTTMDDIAERAGMVRASVFNHFPSKASFLDEFYLRIHAEVIRRASECPAASFRDRLRGFCDAVEAAVADRRGVMRAVVNLAGENGALAETDAAIDQDMLAYLGGLTRDAADAGELREGIVAHDLAVFLLDLLTATSRRWQLGDDSIALGQLLWSRYQCILDGVAVPPGS